MAKGSLEIYYDENENQVISISLYGSGGMDIAGNRSGDSLVEAIGPQKAKCRAGMDFIYCESSINNLDYLVEPREGCPLPDTGPTVPVTTIQPCSLIAGFSIGIEPED